MQSSYAVDYHLFPEHRGRMLTYCSSEPLDIEFFLVHLIASGSRIVAIRRGHKVLSGIEFDRPVKAAAESIVAKLLERSLGTGGGEIRERFGFAELSAGIL